MTPRVDIAWKLTCQTTGCAGKPSTDCTILTGPNKGKPRKGLGLHAGRLLAGDEALAQGYAPGFADGAASRQGEVDGLVSAQVALRNAHQVAVARYDAEVADLKERLRSATDEVGSAWFQVDELKGQLAAAQSSLTEAVTRSKNDQTTIADLRAQIAALTPKPPTPVWTRPTGAGVALYEDLPGSTLNARINAAKVRSLVSFGKGTFEQADFTQPVDARIYGLVLWDKCAGIAGSGEDATIVQLTPGSSTRLAKVPKQSTGKFSGPGAVGTTNPLKVLHAGETTGPRDVYLGGFTLRATDQPVYATVDTPPDPQTGRPHNYNGIELYRAGKVTIEHVRVQGFPGSNGANPGETFSIMAGGSTLDLTATSLELDGRHPVSGKAIGGSGFYHGGQLAKSSLTDVDAHHMFYGWGLTHYMVTGGKSVYTRVRARNNMGAFNWERCSNHTFELVGCDNLGNRAIAKPTAGYGKQPIFAVVDSDQGSVTINLRDVKVDDGTGTLVTPSPQHPVLVVLHPNYWGTTQKQLARDIHVFDAAGVEHPDWLVTLTGYQVDGKGQ